MNVYGLKRILTTNFFTIFDHFWLFFSFCHFLSIFDHFGLFSIYTKGIQNSLRKWGRYDTIESGLIEAKKVGKDAL